MNYDEIDLQLLRSAMDLSAQYGWNHMSLIKAAQTANVPIQTARQRFPCKTSLLIYLNRLADESALTQTYQGQEISDYLFDLFMSRFDLFQEYRQGFISVLHTLPFNPPLTLLMGITTQNSMRWIADSANMDTTSIKGKICIKALMAIWAINLRIWIKDDTQDLSQTMASLDQTIKKAGKFAPYFVTKKKEINPETNTETEDESYFSSPQNEKN